MASIAIDTVKQAIRSWVIRGSGLAPDHVIWTLGAKRPSSTYIHMRIRLRTLGQDFVKVTRTTSPTSGNDATYTVVGTRLLTLTLTCFAPGEPNQGARSPEQILNDVFAAWSLPSINESMNVARLGWLSNTEIVPVDMNIDSSLFEPRATCTITMHTVAQLTETGPAIDSVDIVGTLAGPDGKTGETPSTIDTVELIGP